MTRFDNDRLRELLKDREMSQAKLAWMMGINPRVVSRWCTGQRQPTLQNVLKIAQILRVEPNRLVINMRYKERHDV